MFVSWPHLEDAHDFFGKKRTWIGRLGHAHSRVVGQDDDAIHLRFLRLD